MNRSKLMGGSAAWRFGTLGRVVVLGAAVLWTSCSAADRDGVPLSPGSLVSGRPKSSHTEHTFVVVAIDGVRWTDVFDGVDRTLALAHGMSEAEVFDANTLTPNLHALMEEGVALGGTGGSATISATGPSFVSIPGYLEMMTGRRPTGCTTNACSPTQLATLADDFAEGMSPTDVAVIAAWEGIERAASRDPSRLTLSVGRSHGATRGRLRYDTLSSALLSAGEHAGPEPGHGDFRRDLETAAIALHYLETFRARFLFLGLGETDEYAHDDDYRGYLRALTRADHIIGELREKLSALEHDGRRVTLVVTTDHGRSNTFVGHGGDAPESARVWLVAAGDGIARRGAVNPDKPRHLADLTATLRLLGGVGSQDPSGEPLNELLVPGRSPLAQR